jgi:hypothetical protein
MFEYLVQERRAIAFALLLRSGREKVNMDQFVDAFTKVGADEVLDFPFDFTRALKTQPVQFTLMRQVLSTLIPLTRFCSGERRAFPNFPKMARRIETKIAPGAGCFRWALGGVLFVRDPEVRHSGW